jgi:hypothetical protein
MNAFNDLPLFQHGEQLRDQGIKTVVANAGDCWLEQATDLIQTRLAGQEVLAETFRELCEQENIRPHHHNAWGGLTNRLVKQGVLIDTGRIAKSKCPRSHARRQPIWKVIG